VGKDNSSRPVYAIAIDPGGTTGIAIVPHDEDPWAIEVLQLSGEHHLQLLTLLHDLSPSVVITESFINVGNEAARLASSEMIGVIKCYAQATDTEVVWQAPSIGKQFFTDQRLKQTGLYIVGLQHARDAVRHYAYFRSFTVGDKSILRGGQGSVSKLY
jgi:hypothetical protein